MSELKTVSENEKIPEKRKVGRPRKDGVINFETVARHRIAVRNNLTKGYLPKLTLNEFKFFMYLISLEYTCDPEHRISAETVRYCDINTVAKAVFKNDRLFNVQRNLENFFKGKTKFFVEFPKTNRKTDKSYISFPIFTYIEYDMDNKLFKYSYSDKFLSYVYHDGRNFAESLLSVYLNFKKIHSAYMYWYLCANVFKGAKDYHLEFQIDELARLLNYQSGDVGDLSENKYKYRHFKNDVLDGVIKELNESKDISLELVSYNPQGKVVLSCSRNKTLRKAIEKVISINK